MEFEFKLPPSHSLVFYKLEGFLNCGGGGVVIATTVGGGAAPAIKESNDVSYLPYL